MSGAPDGASDTLSTYAAGSHVQDAFLRCRHRPCGQPGAGLPGAGSQPGARPDRPGSAAARPPRLPVLRPARRTRHRPARRRPGRLLPRDAGAGRRPASGQRQQLPPGREDRRRQGRAAGQQRGAGRRRQGAAAGLRQGLGVGAGRHQAGARDGRRAGLRRLRHHRAGRRLGRLQGPRLQGQGAGHAGQRSGADRAGAEALQRRRPDLLRPLDLQVAGRRRATAPPASC